jgi:hypothetical protein
MELMEIIEVFLLIFFAISALGLSVSFFLYKMKKKDLVSAEQETDRPDYSLLKPQQVFPAQVEMNNAALLMKYKKEQERFNNIRHKGTRPIIYSKLPQKYKVINNRFADASKQQALFRISYANQENVIERYNMMNPR